MASIRKECRVKVSLPSGLVLFFASCSSSWESQSRSLKYSSLKSRKRRENIISMMMMINIISTTIVVITDIIIIISPCNLIDFSTTSPSLTRQFKTESTTGMNWWKKSLWKRMMCDREEERGDLWMSCLFNLLSILDSFFYSNRDFETWLQWDLSWLGRKRYKCNKITVEQSREVSSFPLEYETQFEMKEGKEFGRRQFAVKGREREIVVFAFRMNAKSFIFRTVLSSVL